MPSPLETTVNTVRGRAQAAVEAAHKGCFLEIHVDELNHMLEAIGAAAALEATNRSLASENESQRSELDRLNRQAIAQADDFQKAKAEIFELKKMPAKHEKLVQDLQTRNLNLQAQVHELSNPNEATVRKLVTDYVAKHGLPSAGT